MRRPDGKRTRAAVFLAVVLFVAVGTSIGPYLAPAPLGGEGPEPANYSEYEAASLVPEQNEATGRPSVERRADRGVVVVDESHDNRFTREEVQPLVAAITDAGYRVEFLSDAGRLESALARADAFVAIDPGETYAEGEVDAVERFVDRGGRLAMLGEPTTLRISPGLFGASLSTADNRLSSLSARFGVGFGTDYVYNAERNDGNFRNVPAEATGEDGLVEGVDRTVAYTGTQVTAPNGTELLVAPEGTRSARGDDTGEYALAVRSGGVLAVGDTTFLERANYNVLDNERFVANVAGFLVDGEPERTLREYPAVVGSEDPGSSPSLAYTSRKLLDATQTLGGDLGGRNPRLTLATDEAPEDADVLVTTYDHLDSNGPDDTGIDIERGNVSVPGYDSGTEGVVVIRAPEDGQFDLVVAADKPDRVERGVEVLTSGSVGRYAITDRTAVVRTDEAGSG